jgi:hypothetical protein
MNISFLTCGRGGFHWRFLGVAAVAVTLLAWHHEARRQQTAEPENLTARAAMRGAEISFLRGSISGVLTGDEPASEAALGIHSSLRSLGSMDREWRELLIARNSSDHLRRASFWGFVTGADAAEADTEYGLVFGESLDETFFREMRMLRAKRRRDVGPGASAPSQKAQATSARLRAALIADYIGQSPRELTADANFSRLVAEAVSAPINVQPQGASENSIDGSAAATIGIFTGGSEATGNPVPPSSFSSGSMPDHSSAVETGSVAGTLPDPVIPYLPVPASRPVSTAFIPHSGQGEHRHATASSNGNGTGSRDSVAAPRMTMASNGGDAGAATQATVSLSANAAVSSASGSLVTSQSSVASPASAAATVPKTIYVANLGAGTVNAYDQASGNAVNGFTPIALASVSAVTIYGNTLYAGNFTSSGTISTYNASTGAAINPNLVTGVNQLEGMVVSGNTIYVTSFGSGVLAFDATTGAALANFHPPVISGPRGIAISGSILYVVSNITDNVTALDATTGAVITGFTWPGKVIGASSVAVSGNTLFFEDTNSGTIREYNATTGALTNSQFISGVGFVTEMWVDGNDLYVPSYLAGTLGVYDTTTGLPDPNYTSLSGLNRPWSVAVIPEPGSVVLLAVGAAALVRSRRRRGALECVRHA